MSGGVAEREGGTESEAGSRLWAVSTEPDVGLKSMNHEIMTWAKFRHLTDWATQAPQKDFLEASQKYQVYLSNLVTKLLSFIELYLNQNTTQDKAFTLEKRTSSEYPESSPSLPQPTHSISTHNSSFLSTLQLF